MLPSAEHGIAEHPAECCGSSLIDSSDETTQLFLMRVLWFGENYAAPSMDETDLSASGFCSVQL